MYVRFFALDILRNLLRREWRVSYRLHRLPVQLRQRHDGLRPCLCGPEQSHAVPASAPVHPDVFGESGEFSSTLRSAVLLTATQVVVSWTMVYIRRSAARVLLTVTYANIVYAAGASSRGNSSVSSRPNSRVEQHARCTVLWTSGLSRGGRSCGRC